MSMTIDELRRIVAVKLRLPSFNTFGDLSAADGQRLTDGMAYEISQYPLPWSSSQRDWATARIESGVYQVPLPSYTLLDAARDFTVEAGNQAGRIATFDHPWMRAALFAVSLAGIAYTAVKIGQLKAAFSG
jgi:hypothetical protein